MGWFNLFGKKETKKESTRQGNPNVKLPEGVHFAAEDMKRSMSGADLRKTAVLHYQLAQSAEQKGDWPHAKNYYLHAVENIRGLAESERDKGDLTLLYRCYALLGSGFGAEKDVRQAAGYWEHAFKTECLLIKVDPEDTGHYSAAGISSQWAGYCYRELREYRKACQCYREGLEWIREAETKFGRVFVHGETDGRIFGSFHAEACYRIAEIGSLDGRAVRGEEISEMCTECVQSLVNIYMMEPTEDRNYDIINALYLCGLCLKNGERLESLMHAEDLCRNSLESCQNRMRFTRILKKIQEAKAGR